MLPALYCRLKAKKLLDLIPNDLNIYLEEIANINRGRNELLLKEVHEISEVLNKEKIEHVFIKGTALLASDTFEDRAERMIGDIDILVAEDQIYTAYDILNKNGYTKGSEGHYASNIARHLQRQINPNKFGAIELHREILQDTYKSLINKQRVINNKRVINGIAVPTIEDSVEISILALQVNDKGHLLGYLQFKTIYDCLLLNLTNNFSLIDELSTKKHSQSFLQISSIFFKELKPAKSFNYSKFLERYFLFRLEQPKFGNLIYNSVFFILKNFDRSCIFATNKHYRAYILKNKIFNINRTNFREA